MNFNKKISSNERGITMVSLVITVVILMILSSILLISFDEQEVLDATNSAIADYKTDREEVSDTVDDMVARLDEKGLINESKMELIKEKIKTSTKEELEINYTPEEVKDRLGNPLTITVPSTYNGGVTNQNFTQENIGARGENKIKWYIYSADEKGLNLVSDLTLKEIIFADSPGFDNCLYYLDQISKKLFLNETDYAVSESRVHAFRLSDIKNAAEWYNGTSYNWELRFEDGAPNKGANYKTAVQSTNKYWPGLFAKYLSNGNITILDGPESEKPGSLITDDTGIERAVNGNPATTLTVTGKYYDYDSGNDNTSRMMLFNNLCINNDSEDGYGRTKIIQDEIFDPEESGCWLASRCLKGEVTHTHFCLRQITSGILNNSGLCYSSGYAQTTTAKDEYFRVAVSIPPEHVDIDSDGEILLK